MAKLSDAQFWSALRANGGIYARTARAIEKQYNIPFSRQAVRERAIKDKEQLLDIRQQNLDDAEDTLFTLMRTGPPNVRLKATTFYLERQGKELGYNKQTEVVNSGTIKVESEMTDGELDERIKRLQGRTTQRTKRAAKKGGEK